MWISSKSDEKYKNWRQFLISTYMYFPPHITQKQRRSSPKQDYKQCWTRSSSHHKLSTPTPAPSLTLAARTKRRQEVIARRFSEEKELTSQPRTMRYVIECEGVTPQIVTGERESWRRDAKPLIGARVFMKQRTFLWLNAAHNVTIATRFWSVILATE